LSKHGAECRKCFTALEIRDIVIRCISIEVGIDSEVRFNANVQEAFGLYVAQDPNIMETVLKPPEP